jgi:hypothetical protein
VMATRSDDEVPAGLHTLSPVKDLIDKIRAGAWQRMSCGDGAHGPRVYDWAWTPIRAVFPHGRRAWVLARRSIATGEIAFYRCFAARGTRLRDLVRVAGTRWAIEESFRTAKNEVGLDQYQVRRYDAWYAHITSQRPPPRSWSDRRTLPGPPARHSVISPARCPLKRRNRSLRNFYLGHAANPTFIGGSRLSEALRQRPLTPRTRSG